MSEGDTPLEGPLTVDQAVDRFFAKSEAAQAEENAQEANSEPAEDTVKATEESEVEDVKQDVETEPSEDEEPEDQGDEDQVLTVEEYGDVSVQLGEKVMPLSEIAELVEKGTLRQADYTRKTTEVAAERKALEAEKAEIAEKQRQLDAAILEAGGQEPEPDWEKIFEEDPIDGPLQKERWLKGKAERDRKVAEAQARQQEQLREAAAKTVQQALEVFPEWSDPDAFKAGADRREKAALAIGFTKEEYESTIDARVLAGLELVARGLEKSDATTAAAKKLSKAPKVLKPGRAKASADRKAESDAAAKHKLGRAHTLEDRMKALGY